jgi:hypothetical protein
MRRGLYCAAAAVFAASISLAIFLPKAYCAVRGSMEGGSTYICGSRMGYRILIAGVGLLTALVMLSLSVYLSRRQQSTALRGPSKAIH